MEKNSVTFFSYVDCNIWKNFHILFSDSLYFKLHLSSTAYVFYVLGSNIIDFIFYQIVRINSSKIYVL